MKKKLKKIVFARNHKTPITEPIQLDGQGSETQGRKMPTTEEY